MALLATRFVACSSDDNATTESTETETMNPSMSAKSITNKIPVEENNYYDCIK